MMMGLLSVWLFAAMNAQAPPPQRPAELDTLQVFEGAWNATLGSDSRPSNADGVTTYRWDAGRRWLMYQSSFASVPGLGSYEVHGVVGFDAATRRFRAWAFNTFGNAIEYTGLWETDRRLVFLSLSGGGRVSYAFGPDGRITFTSEQKSADGTFTPYFTATFTRK